MTSKNMYCVKSSYTLHEVIEVIDANQDRVVVVLNDAEKVISVISQGDIIRALVSGISLYAQIGTIVRPSFYYSKEKDMERAYKIFKKSQITMLPVLDEDFHLVDIINLQDIYNYLEGK